jgi:arginase
MKYRDEVMAVSRSLCPSVADAVKEGRLPIVIGGDHSVAMGSIAGVSSVVGAENLAVIYIDGHADINTEQTTETGFIHGMPLAAAMGLCDESLTVGKRTNLLGLNTYIIGARSIDNGEYPIIHEQGVTLYTANDVREKGMKAVMNEVLGRIAVPYVHVSFDVDVLDETVFPATGYRMPNGLSYADAETAVVACFASGKVVSLDVVEYNPTLYFEGDYRKSLISLMNHSIR